MGLEEDWSLPGMCVRSLFSDSVFFFLTSMWGLYIMRNAGLEETQAGITIARRNINNLRYADETTLMAESEEELKASR